MDFFKTTPRRVTHAVAKTAGTSLVPKNPNTAKASPNRPAPLVRGGCATCGKNRK